MEGFDWSGFWISQLWRLPFLLVLIAGTVLAFMFRDRHRTVSTLCLTAFAILFVQLVLGIWLNAWTITAHMDGVSREARELNNLVIGGMNSMLHLVAWVLLLFAMFGWRSDVPAARSPVAAPPGDSALAGIGGWLILPAIGMVLGPVISIAGLVFIFVVLSDLVHAGLTSVAVSQIVLNLVVLGFLIYAAIRFFGKRANVPLIMICLIAANVVLLIMALGIALGAPTATTAYKVRIGILLAAGVVQAAIWIPYFRVSRRVKVTFVN